MRREHPLMLSGGAFRLGRKACSPQNQYSLLSTKNLHLETFSEINSHPVGVTLDPDRKLVAVKENEYEGQESTVVATLAQQAPVVVKVIFHKHNQGKGAALRTGFQAATGDVLVVQDADLEYDPTDWNRMWHIIAEGWADVVYGSRFYGEPHRVLYLSSARRHPIYRAMNRGQGLEKHSRSGKLLI